MAQRIVDGEQYESFLVRGDPGSTSLPVGGKAYRSTTTITRPSDASAYTAGDVVGNASSAIITLNDIGPANGYVFAQSVELIIGSTAVPAGMSSFRLHLYTGSPSAIADNAPFNLTSGEAASYLGYVDLPSPQDFGSVLYSQTDYVGRLIKLASGSTSLFAELETKGAYTPSSGTTHTLLVKTLEAGV